MTEKVAHTGLTVQVSGENGNIFNIVGIVTRALRHNGHRDLVAEIQDRIWNAQSYDEALLILREYVDFE